MRKRIFTSTIAALALFVVVGLIAALAPSIASLNLARAHSPWRAPPSPALTVSRGGDAADAHAVVQQRGVFLHGPRGRYSVAQVTVAGTPDGDGRVSLCGGRWDGAPGRRCEHPWAPGRSLHGRKARQCGGDAIGTPRDNDGPRPIRRAGDPRGNGGDRTRAALMALYNSTNGERQLDEQHQLGEH